MQLSGAKLSAYNSNSPVARDLNSILSKLAAKDSSLWGIAAADEAEIRLDWLELPITSRELLPELDALNAWAREKKLTNFILCGMGGSSLAPEVMAKSFGKELTILDTTDPGQIAMAIPERLENTLVIVGSKSGSTIETSSQRTFFEELFNKAKLDPTEHIVIVTDPNSPLDVSARVSGYRVIAANPQVGGRFSALSAFGLVPATLLGIDVSVLLDDAERESKLLALANSPAVIIATLLFEETVQNFGLCDFASNVPGIGDWIEQLIAESTGKNGKGRLPVVIESPNTPIGGPGLQIGFTGDVCEINIIGSLGEHFIFWEWVTALLCRALKVDPFNQPNVTEAKAQTSRLLDLWGADGIPVIAPAFENEDLAIYSESKCVDLKSAINAFASKDFSYLAVMAYLNRIQDSELAMIRSKLAALTSRAVTFGWGPRFLHSTGQFHKGGEPSGAFIQITGESARDLRIPGAQFTFQTLLMAQALGDAQALSSRKLPLLRIHLKNRSAGISQIIQTIEELKTS